MKKFDGYSIRGLIFSMLAIGGIVYEYYFKEVTEWIVIVLYGTIILTGILLITVIKKQ